MQPVLWCVTANRRRRSIRHNNTRASRRSSVRRRRSWRAPVDFALKAAGLIIAAVLATPYSLDYDMTALAPAIAFLAVHGMRCGFAPYEKSALAALWIAPLVARSLAQAMLLPVGLFAMAAMLIVILHRAAQQAGGLTRWKPSANPAA
jgi:alpha-1,2-mannosyltransferase